MPNSDLDQLASAYWDHYLENNPTEAHLLGDYRFAGDYEDATREAEDRQVQALREFGAGARAIDPDGLDDDERITRAVLQHDATTRADLLEVRQEEFGVDPIFGPQVGVPIVLGMFSLPDATVAEALLDKLQGVSRNFGDLTERLREGVAAGRVPPTFAVAGVVEQLDAQLAGSVSDDPVLGGGAGSAGRCRRGGLARSGGRSGRAARASRPGGVPRRPA